MQDESPTIQPALLRHPWLDPHDQAIMDTATSTAADYSHIALLSWSGLRKDQRKLFPGIEVPKADFIRASTLAPRVGHDYSLGNTALVRLKPELAGMVLGNRQDAQIHLDPTGEQWGNMLIDQATMVARKRTHLCNPESNAKCIVWFGLHGSYGSTLADVEAHKNRQGFLREETGL